MVDAADSKSADSNIMWVKVPSPAPTKNQTLYTSVFICYNWIEVYMKNKSEKIKPRIKQGYIKDSFLIRKQHKTYPSPLNDTASKEIKDSDTQQINFKR